MASEPNKFDGVVDDLRVSVVLKHCRGKLLDFGCNKGNLVGFLLSTGLEAEGIDADPALVQEARRRFPEATFHVGDTLSSFSDGEFDTVVAWNVLEHVKDDINALREIFRISQRIVILSVPKEDEISLPKSGVTYRPYVDLTHFHYYTESSIIDKVRSAAGHPVEIQHVSRIRPLMAYAKLGIPGSFCSMLDRLLWWLAPLREPFFSTLVVVAVKDGCTM